MHHHVEEDEQEQTRDDHARRDEPHGLLCHVASGSKGAGIARDTGTETGQEGRRVITASICVIEIEKCRILNNDSVL